MSPEWWEGKGFLQQTHSLGRAFFAVWFPPGRNKCVTATSPSAATSWLPGCCVLVSPQRGQGRKEGAVAGQVWPSIPNLAFEQDLLEEWKVKGPQVEEIGRRGTLLENLIVEITAPNTPPKAGELWPALLRTTLLSALRLL